MKDNSLRILNNINLQSLSELVVINTKLSHLKDKSQLFLDSLLQISPKHYSGNQLNKIQEKYLKKTVKPVFDAKKEGFEPIKQQSGHYYI